MSDHTQSPAPLTPEEFKLWNDNARPILAPGDGWEAHDIDRLFITISTLQAELENLRAKPVTTCPQCGSTASSEGTFMCKALTWQHCGLHTAKPTADHVYHKSSCQLLCEALFIGDPKAMEDSRLHAMYALEMDGHIEKTDTTDDGMSERIARRVTEYAMSKIKPTTCHVEVADALRLILPMAKGYASEHPVGSNQAYVEHAENVLASQPRATPPQAAPGDVISPGESAARWITDHLWDGNPRIYSELTALIASERTAARSEERERCAGIDPEWLAEAIYKALRAADIDTKSYFSRDLEYLTIDGKFDLRAAAKLVLSEIRASVGTAERGNG